MTGDLPLDQLSAHGVAERLFDAEARVLPMVRSATPRVADAAELIAARMADGGKLVLIGAGTSGRLAVLQAAELPGTFGLSRDRVAARTAGGGPGGLTGTDGDEDDVDAGRRDLTETGFGSGDVLVAVAASGRTPYTLAAVELARSLGGAVVSVTTVAASPLAAAADVAIEVPVGPEVLRGSTRLTAGTAQKLVLDALTTAAMVRLGRVHGDVMIDVVPANAKLRARSAGLVAEIVGCPPDQALGVLDECEGNARAAVLRLTAGLTPAEAAALAAGHRTLRSALAASR
ncbi:N-acetylmuramic acid 6-phosphate etherase [Cryptosporangium aurantiacum]|uniref:N-acetylmuramic acid 6-phosphate etherase n=1 Tax=Cryptosporangium aurantiacum TaxID=134849 RepID=A0A1M7JGS2_9ACTN|nr:N-acetylmuramic acid 6-phosphate etherase [Cryptosporangium aurantiacum]SHM52279.1 N-acetylmuramic acid 6-phosphate etherase [Cryptosporangium aurantiacum]